MHILSLQEIVIPVLNPCSDLRFKVWIFLYLCNLKTKAVADNTLV